MELSNLACLNALGLLDPDDEVRLQQERTANPTLRAEAFQFEEIAAHIGLIAPPLQPSPKLKERLMTSIAKSKSQRQPELEELEPGIHVARSEGGTWRKTPFPGISFRQLYLDPLTKMATSLLRLDPGSVYPTHRHAEAEQAFVLEGSCYQGSVRLKKGDFQLAVGSSVHYPIQTDEGCLLLICSSVHDEFVV